ncbi:TPA: hypothetical protein JRX33_004047 [Elizabethkingia anophelis]|nr:hypothetical protein [Elizabethkingia anophelis]HAY3509538.1 hypothetical protein [Elizabethkingia anophelis]
MKTLKNYQTLIFSFLFVIIFKSYFISVYKLFIVNKILIHAKQAKSTDIVLLLFVAYCVFWTISKIRKGFFLREENLIYSVGAIVLYTYVRCKYNASMVSFKYFSSLKYFDIIYILAIIPFVIITWTYIKLYITPWVERELYKKKIAMVKIDLLDDGQIKNSSEDILGMNNRAIQVFRLLKNNKSTGSIAIGIVGNWGDGKSSFMSLIEESCRKENSFIIVHFNSWLNISIESIIHDFFNTIEKEIAPHSFDVSKEIKRYGNNVLSIYKNKFTETILNITNLLPNNNLSEEFQNLNKLLNKLNKKVIVFFDDLDRLQPNEVFEVLKLIRNTASFDVFNYIVGYDKSYVIEALKNNKIPNPEKYCEKIFLKEFPLLPITQYDINKYLQVKLIEFIPQEQIEIESFFKDLDVYLRYYQVNIFNTINNIRNAKRYLNELIISYQNVKDNIYLKDFIFIKLLKFSYYDTYKLLFFKDRYVESLGRDGHTINEKNNNYKLKSKEEGNFIGKAFDNSRLKEDIDRLHLYNELDIKTIGLICSKIFNDNYSVNKIDARAIAYGNNYYKYFKDEMSDTDFLKADFDYFLGASFSEMKKVIDKAHKEDTLLALSLFIYKIDISQDIVSRKQYENLIKALLYIANLGSDNRLGYYGINNDFLYMITNYRSDTITEKFGYNGIKELKEFLQSLFYREKKYYDFEPEYIKWVCYNYGYEVSRLIELPFTKEEIEKYLVFCFNHNSKQIKTIDSIFWDCYKLCFFIDWTPATSGRGYDSYTRVVKENKERLLYEIIPKHIDSYLVYTILPQDLYGGDKNSFKVGLSNRTIDGLFDSTLGFIEYLESNKVKGELVQETSKFVDEFLTFAKRVEKEEGMINFKFTYLPAIKKLEQEAIKHRL